MIKSVIHTISLLCLMLGGIHGAALGVNKCEVDGKIIYTDTACLDGKSSKLADPVPATDPEGAKIQYAQEKASLKHLEASRHRQEAKDARARAQKARRAAAKQRNCARLHLRKKWVDEDIHAGGKTATNAKVKARRIKEKLALECEQQ